ncbi:hypothetical protein SPSYN_02678 [Sporotomaculum syntrophicum]|uniref:Uncharacterized protein n=1 Tax=Sporotomaculum syntrophicum TaxID=182264 RepID=A0A9D2WN66_9FIRM|nr:hypothetical protein [Sporotomaculum syntrophicum]KAF1084274.1 hypothetical protein SPSYN_02678 [Sporotomaculum syntrophicum]
MYKRYGEVLLRLEELGARAGKLNNSDRNELQSLLEEQVWLGTTMIKKAKSNLEEIDGTFEKIFDWMIDVSDLIDRAAGEAGTPEDLLELENIMDDVVKLKEQLKQLKLDRRLTHAATKQAGNSLQDARLEAAPATAQVRVDTSSVSKAKPVEVAESNQSPRQNTAINDTPTSVESLMVVPAKTDRQAQKKSNKKSNKSKYMPGNQYQPPQELLVSIAEKISPATQLRLLEDAKQFIGFNLPGPIK